MIFKNKITKAQKSTDYVYNYYYKISGAIYSNVPLNS